VAASTRFDVTSDGGTITGERAAYTCSDDRLLTVDRRTSGKGTREGYRYDTLRWWI
jgi:hypothetical protein